MTEAADDPGDDVEDRYPEGLYPDGLYPDSLYPDGRVTGVRPFVVTRGRTAAGTDLAVEAQIITTKRGQSSVDELSFEYRDIVDLCVKPLAVAEISARLGLHLGVVQVLLRDLAGAGYVTTFEPGVGLAFDVQTIQRVIDGLRRLA